MNTPEELAPQVSELVGQINTDINNSLLCPRAHYNYDRTLLALTSKSIRLALAVCSLSQNGFYGEAFGLARSSLETFLRVKYISNKDSEARADSFVDFFKAHLANQEEIRKLFFPNFDKPDEQRKQWIKEAETFPSRTQWVPAFNMATEAYLDPRERSERTGKQYDAKFDYLGIYEHTSHFVHVNSLALLSHYAVGGEQYETYPFPDSEREQAIVAMLYAVAYLFQTCIIALRHFSTELPSVTQNRIHQMLDTLRTALPGERTRFKRVYAEE